MNWVLPLYLLFFGDPTYPERLVHQSFASLEECERERAAWIEGRSWNAMRELLGAREREYVSYIGTCEPAPIS